MVSLDRAFEVDSLYVGELVGLLAGSFDPAVALLQAPQGSLFLREDIPETWQKNGVLPNQWVKLESGAGSTLPDFVIADDQLVFANDEVVVL